MANNEQNNKNAVSAYFDKLLDERGALVGFLFLAIVGITNISLIIMFIKKIF